MPDYTISPIFRRSLQRARASRRLLNCLRVGSPRKLAERMQPSLLLANIGQLLTLRSSTGTPGPRRGPDLKQLGIIEDGAVLSLGGKIVSVGTTKDALRDPWLKKNPRKVLEIDCVGKVVLPGFVDSWIHTHILFLSARGWWILRSALRAPLMKKSPGPAAAFARVWRVFARQGSEFYRRKFWPYSTIWPLTARPRLKPSRATG